jgi:hypothetical protein
LGSILVAGCRSGMVCELKLGDVARDTGADELNRELTKEAKLASAKRGIEATLKTANPRKSL